MDRIVYVHGMGSQVPSAELKSQWDTALFGAEVGFTTFAYWADILHPLDAALAEKINLIDPLLNWITKIFTKEFTPDVYAYLFEADIRQKINDRVSGVIKQAITDAQGASVTVIAHSLGCGVIQDVLTDLNNPQVVSQVITMGNPVGLLNFRVSLAKLMSEDNLLKIAPLWLNFYDRLDPVQGDKATGSVITGVFDQVVNNDLEKQEGGIYRHDPVGYLTRAQPYIRQLLLQQAEQNHVA